MPVVLAVAATVASVAFGVILESDVECNPGPRRAAMDCHNTRSLHHFPRNTVRLMHF